MQGAQLRLGEEPTAFAVCLQSSSSNQDRVGCQDPEVIQNCPREAQHADGHGLEGRLAEVHDHGQEAPEVVEVVAQTHEVSPLQSEPSGRVSPPGSIEGAKQ